MRGYGNERRDHTRSAAMTRVILCGVIDKGIVMAVRLSSNTTADDVRQEIVSALNLTAELQLFLAQNEDGTWWRPDATRLLEEQDTRGLCEVTSTSSLGHFFTQSQRDAAIHILAKVVEAQRPETTKSTIRCGFYGCGLVNEFEIDLNLTVQDLMNQIVERTRTPRVPQLYLTRTGRHWLRVEDGMKGVLDQKVGHRYTELCSSDVLHERFGYDFESCKEHLHVLVELAGPRQVSVDQSFLELTQCYRSIGKMCKSNKEVQEVLDAVVSVQRAGQPTPFIVVQGSSGVGKTQIAFTLMENHDMDVFYIVSQVSAAGELIQPIYGAVRTRSVVFSQCVEDDLKKVCKGGVEDIGTYDYLYTYSFITALLRGHTHFVGRGLRRDVMEAIRCRSRPCIFFLDEFPDCSMGGTERLRFMRNVFRSFGLTVIVSSTNESARNMLSQQTQSRGSDTRMWCYIVPIFAKFQAVSSDVIPTKLRYVIANSRPMFAQAALGYLRENLWSSNPVDYMDSMAGHIATQCSENKMRLSQGFRTGQVCLFLCASYVDDQENRLICDHFAVLAENMAFGLQLSSERRLSKRDEHTPWVCRSVFPPVETDLLLYLCFLGGKAFGAMRGSNGNRIPFRKALQEAEDAEWSVICFKNTNQNSNDGMRLEALATGAMVLASHANGFAGVPFDHFFSVLLYELGVQNSLASLATLLLRASSIIVPFLAPPNMVWPKRCLPTELNLGSIIRPKNNAKVDIKIISGLVSAECKDYGGVVTLSVMKKILVRMPDSSHIHLVFTNRLQSEYFTRDENASDEGVQDGRVPQAEQGGQSTQRRQRAGPVQRRRRFDPAQRRQSVRTQRQSFRDQRLQRRPEVVQHQRSVRVQRIKKRRHIVSVSNYEAFLKKGGASTKKLMQVKIRKIAPGESTLSKIKGLELRNQKKANSSRTNPEFTSYYLLNFKRYFNLSTCSYMSATAYLYASSDAADCMFCRIMSFSSQLVPRTTPSQR